MANLLLPKAPDKQGTTTTYTSDDCERTYSVFRPECMDLFKVEIHINIKDEGDLTADEMVRDLDRAIHAEFYGAEGDTTSSRGFTTSLEEVHSMLGLVMDPCPPLSVMRRWSANQRRDAEVWAAHEHVAAASEPGDPIPKRLPKPVCIFMYEVQAQKG